MRRVGCWYLKRSAGTRAFREQISKAESLEQVEELILNFPLIENDSFEKNSNESLEENE
jgi:tRNA-dihydrouridine synthase B